jgi:hypothetical protein
VVKVASTGSNGWKEMIQDLSDGKVFFGLCAFEVNKVKKLVYLAWCGEGGVGMKKGTFATQAKDAEILFKAKTTKKKFDFLFSFFEQK